MSAVQPRTLTQQLPVSGGKGEMRPVTADVLTCATLMLKPTNEEPATPDAPTGTEARRDRAPAGQSRGQAARGPPASYGRRTRARRLYRAVW